MSDQGRRVRRIEWLAQRDGWRCRYCSVRLGFGPDDVAPTIDHVIPLSKHGSNRMDNLALACEPCNHDKGDKLVTPRDVRPSVPMDSTCRHTSAAAICLNCAAR